MFLKRRKFNNRVLFNKFFIDLWLFNLQKKKFRVRRTQRFLQFFSRYFLANLSRLAFGSHQSSNWKRRERSNNERNSMVKASLKSMVSRRPIVTNFLNKNSSTATSSKNHQLLKFKHKILNALQSRSRCYHAPVELLLLTWNTYIRKKFLADITQRRRTRMFPSRFFNLRRKDEYIVTPLLDLTIQQYHFGFSSMSSFKSYLKRINFLGNNSLAFGLDGMLANQLWRIGLVQNVRMGYVLVKSGAIVLNGNTEKNPRRLLFVDDILRVDYRFSRYILQFYRDNLASKKIVLLIPQFYEFNFRLMIFKLWRKPTLREISLINYYPFFKKELNWGSAKYLSLTK